MNVLLIKRQVSHANHAFSKRSITINAKMSSDPYYLLGVDRQTSFPEIKK